MIMMMMTIVVAAVSLTVLYYSELIFIFTFFLEVPVYDNEDLNKYGCCSSFLPFEIGTCLHNIKLRTSSLSLFHSFILSLSCMWERESAPEELEQYREAKRRINFA